MGASVRHSKCRSASTAPGQTQRGNARARVSSDGHEIAVGDNLLTACTSEGTAVSLPIGAAGLRDVAAKLLALADANDAVAAERTGAALEGCK